MTTEKITPFWPTPAAAHDHLADTFPEETGNRRFVTIDLESSSLRELESPSLREFAAKMVGPFDVPNINAVYGKFGTPDQYKNAGDAIAVDTVMLPRGGKMVSGSANQLRNYIMRDIETTEELKKRFDIEHAITEGLRMQARGRAAPLPRPKPLDVYVQHAVDNWSNYK